MKTRVFYRWNRWIFLFGVLLVLPLHIGVAQYNGYISNLPSYSPASYYNTAKSGDVMMQVNIWGFVLKPGRYEVPSTTDLVQLLSFAGGPLQYSKMSNIKITRFEKVDSVVVTKEIIVDLTDVANVNQTSLKLCQGDVVEIGHTAWIELKDIFSIFTTVAMITSAIVQVMYWSSK
jgi:hypothetical protein